MTLFNEDARLTGINGAIHFAVYAGLGFIFAQLLILGLYLRFAPASSPVTDEMRLMQAKLYPIAYGYRCGDCQA